jgi:AhpD family alkylhydroperoxidase
MTSASRIAPGDRRQVGRLNHAVATALGRLHGTTPPNLFLTLGRHRRLFRAWLVFAGALMPGGRLRRRDTELVILRVAHRRGCVYELDHHRRLGVRAGLAPADIDELAEPDAPAHPRWSAREAALLAAVDQLLDDRDVDDATWAELARHLDERRLVELVLLVGHYDMLATTIATLRIQPDPPRRGRTGR